MWGGLVGPLIWRPISKARFELERYLLKYWWCRDGKVRHLRLGLVHSGLFGTCQLKYVWKVLTVDEWALPSKHGWPGSQVVENVDWNHPSERRKLLKVRPNPPSTKKTWTNNPKLSIGTFGSAWVFLAQGFSSLQGRMNVEIPCTRKKMKKIVQEQPPFSFFSISSFSPILHRWMEKFMLSALQETPKVIRPRDRWAIRSVLLDIKWREKIKACKLRRNN